jgi:hypothetical protein
MPFSFPSSPSVGQQSTQNGRTYSWSGAAWELVAASGGSGLSWSSVPAYPSATGTTGQIAYDSAGNVYLCTATDTWLRSTFLAWGQDSFFSNVALLLRMNGTNGSTTFTDSSSAARAVTVNGSAAISDAQSKWGGASGYFNGSSSLSVANASALIPSGSATFVMEFWVRPDSSQASSAGLISTRALSSGQTATLELNISSSGTIRLLARNAGGWAAIVDTAGAISAVQWSHVAIVSNSGVTTIYINGAAQTLTAAVGTSNGTSINIEWSQSGSTLYIGSGGDASMTGYMDDLRITTGSTRGYSGSSITVPAAPFPNS